MSRDPSFLSQRPVLASSIAASAAAVMAFHGLLHEIIGPTLFPWLPPLFGPLLWHGLGIAVLLLGALVWAGVVGLLRFPVVPVCFAIAALGLGVVVFIWMARAQFHFLALCLAILATITAIFHRR